MAKMQKVALLNEKFKKVLEKNRLRLLLLYPEAETFLKELKIVDAKKHTYYNQGNDKLVRRRLKVTSGEEVLNITAFEKHSANILPRYTTLVNGKFVGKETIVGTSFSSKLETSEIGQKFLMKLFEDFDLEKACTELKQK